MSDTKAEWLKQKEQQAAERKQAAKVARIEKQIEETEDKIASLDAEMAEHSTDYTKAQELFAQRQALEETLEELYQQWEEMQ